MKRLSQFIIVAGYIELLSFALDGPVSPLARLLVWIARETVCRP